MFKTWSTVPNWSKKTLFGLCSKCYVPFDTNSLLLLALSNGPGPPHIHDKLIMMAPHTHTYILYAKENIVFNTYQIDFLTWYFVGVLNMEYEM